MTAAHLTHTHIRSLFCFTALPDVQLLTCNHCKRCCTYKREAQPQSLQCTCNNTNNRWMQTISKREIQLVRIFSTYWQMTKFFTYIKNKNVYMASFF